MAHSLEYLQAIYTAAKSFLPAWVWDQVHKKAFPSSGGRATANRRVTKQAAPTSPAGLNSEGLITALQIRGEQYSKTEAGYFQPTKDMTACGACRFFLRDPRGEVGLCQIVVGGIAWFGTCNFYISALEEAMFALQNLVEKQDGFEIQTIIFPKDRWTLARARRWLVDHDFTDAKVDETENSYRFRQAPPGDFLRIRPVCLTPSGADPNLEDCSVLAFGGVTKEDMAKESHEHPGHFQARQKFPEMGTCEGHGCKSKAFDRHHKDGNPANNARSNVMFLCRQCHMLADGRTHQDPTKKADGMTQKDIDLEIDKALHLNRRKRRNRKPDKYGGVEKDIPILKLDEEKQVVYGVVLDPYIVDTQGDWSPPAEVEKTAHGWMEISRTIGLGHKGAADATPVESFLMPYPSTEDYRAAMENEPHRIIKFKFGTGFVHSGSWVLGTKVKDDETWALVKSGELGSYSIGGHGERTEIVTSIMPRITETIEADWSQAA